MRKWALSTRPRFAPDMLDLAPDALVCGVIEAASAPCTAQIQNLESLRQMPGVVAILTADDVPEHRFTTAGQPEPEPSPYDMKILNTVVRYPGEPIALIAAHSEKDIKSVQQCAEIDYQPVHGPFHESHPSNVMSQWDLRTEPLSEVGNEQFRTTVRVPRVSHMQLEPHAALSYFDEENRLVIVTTTQVPYHVRRIVARALGWPVSRILVKATDVGGGFGGKQEVIVEPWVALLAVWTKKPVKMMLNRRQEFTITRTRHAATLNVESTWNNTTLQSIDLKADVETGPYGSHGPTVAHNMGLKSLPLYHAKNYHFHGQVRYTPGPVAGAFRGYGGPQGAMAIETHINQVAHAKGLSSAALRHLILAKKGDALDIFAQDGMAKRQHHNDLGELLATTMARIQSGPPVGENEGIGLAMSMQASGVPGQELAQVVIHVDEDGSLVVKTGAMDIGQGSKEALAQIIYEALDLPVDSIPIYFSMGKTSDNGFDYGTYASSTTYVTGYAAFKAARIVRRKMLALARRISRASSTPLSPLAACWYPVAHASFYGPWRHPIMGQGIAVPTDSPAPFAILAVRLKVYDTGQLDIQQMVMGIDVGKPINPMGLRGQIEGAVVQGLGYALCEELELDEQDAHVRNASLFDYPLITPQDIPPLEIIIADHQEQTVPFGGKSAGEVALAPVAPAIVDGIFQAKGIWMTELPITMERLWYALQAQHETIVR
ncbi:MAG: xanthine dehydrogenase [Sulfobacillus thermosulfidooxidans]|uniref:Xanthine dehydrogenase n=1 Tax=Sulfobacillus thermosulfidooxidans TaxID=28034 RepID=A0A2T2X438_SULTH|nr:MAG: xanthine dehydrogenase [Sulfobacillus thermosulfidooxidans]